MNGLVRYFRSNPQVLVFLVICLVLGIAAFITVVISFASSSSHSLSGEPSGAVWILTTHRP